MIFDPGDFEGTRFGGFMNSVVLPRPIAFVTTVDPEGHVNAAPFSWFVCLSSRPPRLGISISLRDGGPKDTLRNLRATGELVVNVVTEAMAAQIVEASGDWPPEVDELKLTGLTPVASDLVRPPRVAESPVNLECRLEREIELGESTLVVAGILRAHARDDVLTNGRVDAAKLRPLARLGGDGYAGLGELRRLPRPKVERPTRQDHSG